MTRVVINQKFLAVGSQQSARLCQGFGGQAAEPSEQAMKVAEMFGIGLDETYEVTLYDGLALDVRPGDVVFITGPSGSGKSVLLARLAEALAEAWPDSRAVNLASIDLPRDRAVIDLMQPPLEEALRILSAAGLADAFLLLRTPQELSDGQRYRLRLAKAIEALLAPASRNSSRGREPAGTRDLTVAARPGVLVADEFCSTLDRLCARAVAYRVRRMADTHGVAVLAASAHDDLVEDLAPDVLIYKHEGDRAEVTYACPERSRRADPSRGVRP
jgi:hypothetical protein